MNVTRVSTEEETVGGVEVRWRQPIDFDGWEIVVWRRHANRVWALLPTGEWWEMEPGMITPTSLRLTHWGLLAHPLFGNVLRDLHVENFIHACIWNWEVR